MGKIVKFCSNCDEGFAEKFGFCPNCGQSLAAFEMNPVAPAVEPPAPAFIEPAATETAPIEEMHAEEPITEVMEEPIPEYVPEVEAAPANTVEADSIEPVQYEPEIETVIAHKPVFVQTTPVDVDRQPASLSDAHSKAQLEGEYYLTVIEEKDTGTRNGLLLGATGLMLVVMFAGLVASIFSKDLDVGSIGEETFLASLIEDVPMAVEEEKQKEKDDDAGGGGGGGREEEETTQGDLANQTPNPQRAPQAIPRLENPSLVLPPASTQGNKTFEQKFDRYGDPTGRFLNWNNGTGTGGGQGSGTGTGQGSGRGTGAGSGDGSGYGGGLGDGNGDGRGSGDSGAPPPPPSRPAGVTSALRVISKPKPGYTEAARLANTQGTVLLRVTFLASGEIGSISTVKGLPNGLTEKAIAAARGIRFEPAKRDGVPQNTVRTLEFSFAIY
jgi:TonB family protein